jgi:hypothetical protein
MKAVWGRTGGATPDRRRPRRRFWASPTKELSTSTSSVSRSTWHWEQRLVAERPRVASCGLGGAKPTPATAIPSASWHETQGDEKPWCGVHRSGIETFATLDAGRLVLGTTGGYLVGFLVASAVVGGLAQRGWDRRIGRSLGAMVIGSLTIYIFGVTWLAIAADLPVEQALTFGLWPFLPGDILKLLLAAGLLPLGWRLAGRRASGGNEG